MSDVLQKKCSGIVPLTIQPSTENV